MAKRKKPETFALSPEKAKAEWLKAKEEHEQATSKLAFQRMILEQCFPPGVEIPDFPYRWSEAHSLEVVEQEMVPQECFSRVPDTKKLQAWRIIHKDLPPGVVEKTSYRLIERKG